MTKDCDKDGQEKRKKPRKKQDNRKKVRRKNWKKQKGEGWR